AANVALQQCSPSLDGAVSSISVQYSASVPGRGVSLSTPSPTATPVSSRISTLAPPSAHAPELLAPAVTVKRFAILTGEGTAHTARLVRCGTVCDEITSVVSQ